MRLALYALAEAGINVQNVMTVIILSLHQCVLNAQICALTVPVNTTAIPVNLIELASYATVLCSMVLIINR